jgi:NAD(P)-dependent dehydrogenase (short-subunit alcohol dehydrogenase family)
VDIRDADVVADLSTPDGRARMIERVTAIASDGIDGILTSAGATVPDNAGFVVATNYFGTIATLEGLYPLLRKPGARCVSVSSVGMLHTQEITRELETACLKGDEEKAKRLGDEVGTSEAYPATKWALSVWSRRTAISPEWAGSGVLLNIVAPGVIYTPMTTAAKANPDIWKKIQEGTPCPVGEYAEAEDVAEVMDFLLNCRTSHLVGQLIFLDSGSEATLRPHF